MVGGRGAPRAVSRALNLIPFAGIAFLWFIAVIRAQVGAEEDRFVGTVFLGSGLIFVALLFAAAAALKAVLTLQEAGIDLPPEGRAYGWALAAALLGTFGTRMAAIFVATVATSGRRARVLPPWLAFSGYVVAVALLFTPPLPTVDRVPVPCVGPRAERLPADGRGEPTAEVGDRRPVPTSDSSPWGDTARGDEMEPSGGVPSGFQERTRNDQHRHAGRDR